MSFDFLLWRGAAGEGPGAVELKVVLVGRSLALLGSAGAGVGEGGIGDRVSGMGSDRVEDGIEGWRAKVVGFVEVEFDFESEFDFALAEESLELVVVVGRR